MPDYDIKEGVTISAMGIKKDPKEAIERLNWAFRQGRFSNSLLGNKPVVLKERALWEENAKEYPVKIIGKGTARVASISIEEK